MTILLRWMFLVLMIRVHLIRTKVMRIILFISRFYQADHIKKQLNRRTRKIQ